MSARVGVVDWGIGGIDFFARFRRARPTVPVVYLSDAGAPPYGTLPRAALIARLERVVDFMASRRVTHLVVACNAASTVVDAPALARAAHAQGVVALTGVIAPTLAAVRLGPGAHVGVVGGRRTILSRRYYCPLVARGLHVHQRIAQPLSALVERGETDGPHVRAAVARVLLPLPRVDALVLACTHYVALVDHFRRHHEGPIVDPASETLTYVTRQFRFAPSTETTAAFFTTGSAAAMKRAAQTTFGVDVGSVKRVQI